VQRTGGPCAIVSWLDCYCYCWRVVVFVVAVCTVRGISVEDARLAVMPVLGREDWLDYCYYQYYSWIRGCR